ncbi:uncharacterized [Tachysurus ichikawai]
MQTVRPSCPRAAAPRGSTLLVLIRRALSPRSVRRSRMSHAVWLWPVGGFGLGTVAVAVAPEWLWLLSGCGSLLAVATYWLWLWLLIGCGYLLAVAPDWLWLWLLTGCGSFCAKLKASIA